MTKQVEINGNFYNSYERVDEDESYFDVNFGSEWDNVGQTQKPQLLVTATRLIDKKDFQGVKVDENQPLKLPRVLADGTITDDNLVMQACVELAMNVYSDGGKNVDISNIKSVGLGDSSITFRDNSSVTESDDDLLIDEFLSDYLMGGVRVILWQCEKTMHS